MPRFRVGDSVRVRRLPALGHVRTPHYARGKPGQIAAYVGSYPDPEAAAAGGDGRPWRPLYRVRFTQTDMWPDYSGPATDTLDVEIYEQWLESE